MDKKFHVIHQFGDLLSLGWNTEPVILVAGTLDGVHLGHQALIKRAQEEALRIGGRVVALTFDRHPASLLRPMLAPALLTTVEEKVSLLQELNLDAVLLLAFEEALANVPAEEFIHQLRQALPCLRGIVVGGAWSFGKGGDGNIGLLEELGKRMNFSVMMVTPIEVQGLPVSSTRIRRAIAEGRLQEAEACLGRPYSWSGKIVEGNKKAREFGFPTANLSRVSVQLPPDGVYAVVATIGSHVYQGIANIGHCPTLHDLPFPKTVEVHLFNFHQSIYGSDMRVMPIASIRPEIKFPNVEALRLQIVQDVAVVKEIFSKYSS